MDTNITGREVSAKAVSAVFEVVEKLGFDPSLLLKNAPYTTNDFQEKVPRYSWDAFKAILEALKVEHHLSHEEFINIGSELLNYKMVKCLTTLTSLIYPLPEVYNFIYGRFSRIFSKDLISCISLTPSLDNCGNFTITLNMYDGYKFSEECVYLIAGIFTVLPVYYKLHPIKLDIEFSENTCIYKLKCPEKNNFLRKTVRALFCPFFTSKYFNFFKTTNHELLLQNQKFEKQVQELEETKRKLEHANTANIDFIACVCHEIRTPLNGIIGMNHILSETVLDSEQKECVSAVKNSSEHLLEVLNGILDYSKLDAGKRGLEIIPFNSFLLLSDTCRVFYHHGTKIISFNTNFDTLTGVWLHGDPTAIRQILFNLINNAFKFTSQGTVSVIASYENGNFIFTVSDSGIGIAKDKQKSIFEPFMQADNSKTREYGGTGLGLTVSYTLIKQMGGEIEMESELGSGTSFTVSIPLKREFKNIPQKVSLSNDEDILCKEILVVDDNTINQKIIGRFLESIGQNITYASNGIEAIEAIDKEMFDLILMDIKMPIMSGDEAAVIIRKQPRYELIPILALTAEALGVSKEYYQKFGMNDYISKPIDKENFLGIIRSYLR